LTLYPSQSRPELVGILNITPDSFSDGGLFFGVAHCLKHALEIIDAGAQVLEVGAESTRPNAAPIGYEEEWRRISPVIEEIAALCKSRKVILSVDTRHWQVAEQAILRGANWINDVTGATDNKMIEIIAKSNAKFVLNHSLSVPVDPHEHLETDDIVAELLKWCTAKIDILEQAGIDKSRVIFDPGIGFGKSATQSVEIIKNTERFIDTGCKVMIGHSRKSFIRELTGNENPMSRDPETYAISIYLADKNVDYLRVHDVSGNVRALKTWQKLK